MLVSLTRFVIRRPRQVLAGLLVFLVAAGAFGATVFTHLLAGGQQNPAGESARADKTLAATFGQSGFDLTLVVRTPDGVNAPPAQAAGARLTTWIGRFAHVASVSSPWNLPPSAAAPLISKDGKSALVVARLDGGEDNAPGYAKEIADAVGTNRDGLTITPGGTGILYSQINQQSELDLLVSESIAIPLTFLVLVWVFGGLVAAMVPMAVAGFTIVATLGILRTFTLFTHVSIYALNLTTAMGLALAVDYTLLIISRYREEVAAGPDRDEALVRTMATAGRTVLLAALTVGLSLAALGVFPMYFLRSFAYAGVAVVAFASLAAIVLTPVILTLTGDQLDAFDMRRALRRLLGRPDPAPKPIELSAWYRFVSFVIRHAVPVGLAILAVLAILGAPFLGLKFGFPDDRILAPSLSSRHVGDDIRAEFGQGESTTIIVVLPDAAGVAPAQLADYASRLSGLADVAAVSAPDGAHVKGRLVGPPVAPAGAKDGKAFLTVNSDAKLYSPESERLIDQLHAVPGPAGAKTELTGYSLYNRDLVDVVTARLPIVLGFIALSSLVLLFLLTGSVVLPVKALVLNTLSLSAALGLGVWIFQDGHLGGFGVTTTGTIHPNMLILIFCVAFGLSMDYEVFVVARIREYWLASGRTRADNDQSVVLGLARTARVVTAAALLMSIVFAALLSSQVAFMRMFALCLTVAVLVDATLVRAMLVPAFMRLMGQVNWWAPGPLQRWHERWGLRESGPSDEEEPRAEEPRTTVSATGSLQ